MKITGKTRVFGIIGWPVTHSLSPVMHNAAFEYLGLDFCYLPFLVKGGNLDSASSVGVPISFSVSGVSIGDFTIFGYVSLGLSAFFSALMISVIKKGNVKSGIKYIPIYMAVSFLIYMIAQKIMNMVLGVFIQF